MFTFDPESRDEDEGSIITSLISQLRYVVPWLSYNSTTIHLRVGMDLSKVTFPTFVLEPRSMLERITDFMAHPDLIFGQVLVLFFISTNVSFSSVLKTSMIQKNGLSGFCNTT